MHHTGGSYNPNVIDKRSYHKLIDGNATVHDGLFAIEANAGKLIPGKYAAHTLDINTDSIGVAICGMAGANHKDPSDCKFFPTNKQVDAMTRLVADLCIKHNIKVTKTTVMTHAEVQKNLGVAQKSKWDFDYDPYDRLKSRDPAVIGDMLREKIRMSMPLAKPKRKKKVMEALKDLVMSFF